MTSESYFETRKHVRKVEHFCDNRWRYTIEDLTVSLNVGLYLRTILKKFRILKSKNFWPRSCLPVKFAFFLKSRLLFNISYCFCVFVNKNFTYLGCVCLKKWTVLQWETFGILFLGEDKDVGRFSYLNSSKIWLFCFARKSNSSTLKNVL